VPLSGCSVHLRYTGRPNALPYLLDDIVNAEVTMVIGPNDLEPGISIADDVPSALHIARVTFCARSVYTLTDSRSFYSVYPRVRWCFVITTFFLGNREETGMCDAGLSEPATAGNSRYRVRIKNE